MLRKSAVLLLVPSIILAGAILSCSSIANLPNPFASSTPTATATFTPTVTPSPMPTTTPTSTPAATALPSGMIIEDQPGSGSLFYDYDGGYSVAIPAGWLAFQVDAEDIRAGIARLGNTNPEITNSLKLLLAQMSDAFRIVAYDMEPAHSTDADITNFNILMSQDEAVISMPLGLVVRASLEQMKKELQVLRTKQFSTKPNAHGVTIAAAELELTVKSETGRPRTLYEKQLYFQTGKAIVLITLSVPADKAKLVVPSFDEVFDGIKLIER